MTMIQAMSWPVLWVWKENWLFSLRNSLNAQDSGYIPHDEANDRIEHLAAANQDLLEKVNTIGNEVKKAIEKVRSDNIEKRKKRREEVASQMYDDLNLNNMELINKIQERDKLYKNLQDNRKEIKTLKLRLETLGGNDKITTLKDNYKRLVDENYILYENVKTAQKEHDRLTKEIESIIDADPEYDNKLNTLKMNIETEK